MTLDERGVELSLGKRRMCGQGAEEVPVRGRADDPDGSHGLGEAAHGGRAIRAPHDDLGDQGIVVDGDLVALIDAGVDAHVGRFLGQSKELDAP